MQAPHIPNLNTLRTGRGGLRRRGRGDASGPLRDPLVQTGTTPEQRKAAEDRVVQGTDLDASVARKSAVDAGYMVDPFADFFCFGEPGSRLPLMNRGNVSSIGSSLEADCATGTYLRTQALDQLVGCFLEANLTTPKQIISLGAGSDTRLFRIRNENPNVRLLYHELDFPKNTEPKIRAICSAGFKEKTSHCFDHSKVTVSADGARLSSPTYHIHAFDLRMLQNSESEAVVAELDNQIERGWPTLIISECCLIYLTESEAEAAVLHLLQLFSPSASVGLIVYEPVRPNDAFGQTMIQNLAARGVRLQTLEAFPTLQSQRGRLKKYGFLGMHWASDMEWIWRTWIPAAEKQRIHRLEFMDEMEEWQMFLTHYCVAWGSTEVQTTGEGDFRHWLKLPAPQEEG